jgi:hypothetical protein
MRSCSNRVIELNLKMLILTRFVTKNYLNEIIITPQKIEKILLPVLCFDQLKGFPEK